MNKQSLKKNTVKFKTAYYFASIIAFLCGAAIYAFFRNIDNMIIFNFFPKPYFLNYLHIPLKADSVWFDMFIYNLPYGLWCVSGLFLIRAVWIRNTKWRKIYGGIFIFIVMSYVILKLPGIIPGTFDVLDIVIMCLFAFVESIIFNLFIRRKVL